MSPVPAHPSAEVPAFGFTQVASTALGRILARRIFSLEARGLEHLPAEEPFLLCSNHASHADTFALATATGALSRRLVFLGAQDYFSRLRWRRWLVQRVICLVDFDRRGTGAAAVHNLRTLGACRDAGRIVVLFPEGTRSTNGSIGPFKPGAAMFAEKLGLRVVPCLIEGTRHVLRKGQRWPRKHSLRVSFGHPRSVTQPPENETAPERTARRVAFMSALRDELIRLGAAPRPAAPAVPV